MNTRSPHRLPDANGANGPTEAQNLATLLVRTARRYPSLPALGSGSAVVADYATLARRVASMAAALSTQLDPGDRVLLAARNSTEYIETLFACWHAGLCAVPANAKLHPAEMEYMAANSGARWAFVDEGWHPALSGKSTAIEQAIVLGGPEYRRLSTSTAAASSPKPVDATSPAWIFYTSGTTGRPKGVVLSHANLLAMTLCFLADVEPVCAGDSILHAAPLSHGSGLYVLAHVVAGAVNVVPESQGFDAGEILSLLPAWRQVRMFAAPTMVKRIVDHPMLDSSDLTNFASIVYGGGPMYVEDCRRAHAALGPRLAQIYGQGESPMTITAMPRRVLDDAIERNDDARLGSVGTAQPGIDIVIADADDRPLPAGEIGEVLVRGPTVMQGYWNNPDATRATLASGWLHTGDLGSLDSDGFLTLKDRSKDVIISGGSNIYPREVEEALLGHPRVAEVSVIGRPHPEWGEEVVACVVVRDGGNDGARDAPNDAAAERAQLEAELDQACLARIARFKRPRAYLFFSELPKNSAGKVLKTALRNEFASS